MKPIDVAIDDYMHVIARTHPWTMKREEACLEAFSDWLYAQTPAHIMLDDIAPGHVQHYASTTALSPADQHELHSALSNVYRWSAQQSWIEHNPFAVGHS